MFDWVIKYSGRNTVFITHQKRSSVEGGNILLNPVGFWYSMVILFISFFCVVAFHVSNKHKFIGFTGISEKSYVNLLNFTKIILTSVTSFSIFKNKETQPFSYGEI